MTRMRLENHDDVSDRADRESGELYVLERHRRLSRSILWSLQRGFYDNAGVHAWRTATVPHYVTNNPALAHAYAEVALGFLRDRAAAEGPSPGAAPCTVIELGAGSGRFAYLFLKAFEELRAGSPMAALPFRYVMTDFTESNISFWRAHDALRPFVERGMLDFALFDAERDADLQLEHAGTTLVKGSLGAAMVIANYVFDGISQDAFSFAEGELRECLVSLTSEEPVDDVAAPGLVGRLAASYEHRPASFDYYEEPAFNDILRSYGSHADGATILFPSAALRCLLRLSDLAGGRLLLLSGDRGEIHADALGEPECLGMAIHGGGFSVPVNYHAIAEYVLAAGGHVMKAPHRHTHLNVSAFVLGEHPFAWAETRLAYRGAFERGGPDDFFSLRRGILDHSDPLELHQTLSLVRSSRWDPRVLVDVLPSLWQQLGDATEPARRELRRTVERVWASYYHIGEDLDLAFELGLFLYALGAPAEAMAMFAESARLYGEDARARWNVGLCHYALGCVDEAARCFVEAARLDPGFKPQGALQVKTAL